MEKTISLLEGNLLHQDAEIYSILRKNPPIWWKNLINDKEIYIEVRKNDELMAYYHGGRAAGITFMKRSHELIVTAHPKYLGHTDKSDSRYYKQNEKHSPIYQRCEEWLTNRMDELKMNITKHYSGKEEGEDTSEKFIQGNLILNGRDTYLDSEFAHRFHDGEKNTIRIDLVRIENNRIIFEELKRIVDGRLRTKKGDPEILDQMTNYRAFLKVNQDRLTEYYKTLYQIKRDLSLPVPDVSAVSALSVDIEPRLLIAQNYSSLSDDRLERIRDIEKALSSIDVTPKYI